LAVFDYNINSCWMRNRISNRNEDPRLTKWLCLFASRRAVRQRKNAWCSMHHFQKFLAQLRDGK